MQSLVEAKELMWQHITAPTPEELAALVREAALTPLDAEFIASNYHRPEVTVRPTYILLLAQVPAFNKQTRITTGVPLYIIVGPGKLWTLTYERLVVLEKLIQEFTEREDKRMEYFTDGAVGVALQILQAMYASAFRKLDRLHMHINIAEDAVFQGNERKMVEEISILARDVMDFRKIIRPQQTLFQTAPRHPLVTEEMATLWLRVGGQVSKLWDVLESISESILELRKTNSTLLQYKENLLLQKLTYFSVISIPVLMILTPINPYSASTGPTLKLLYWGVLLVLLLGLVATLWRFKDKRVL